MKQVPDSETHIEGRYTIQSVRKALLVLRLFLAPEARRGLLFSEVVSMSGGLGKSNVLRILSTLKEEGFLSYDRVDMRYYLGPVFADMRGQASLAELKAMLEGDLSKAASDAGVIVHFTVLDGAVLRILVRCFPRTNYESLVLASVDDPGVPVNATGAGKIYMAFADEATASSLLDSCPFESYSPNTITDRGRFLECVDEVRQKGYALNICEHEEFLCCLSRPVFGSGGRLVGALSYSGLKDMFTLPRFERIDRLNKALAESLSRRFGYSIGGL